MIQEEEECFLSQAASLMDVMKRIFQSEPKSTIFKIKVEMLNLVSRDLLPSVLLDIRFIIDAAGLIINVVAQVLYPGAPDWRLQIFVTKI